MAAENSTSEVKVVGRGAFPAVGPKVGLIENTVSIIGLDEADDSTAVFTLRAGTLVMGMGIEVIIASENAVTGSLGLDGSGAGSRTEFSGELATNGTAGTMLAAGYLSANVMLSGSDSIVFELSADPGATGSIRVWAIIADVDGMT